jgi:hypothetical protein
MKGNAEHQQSELRFLYEITDVMPFLIMLFAFARKEKLQGYTTRLT